MCTTPEAQVKLFEWVMMTDYLCKEVVRMGLRETLNSPAGKITNEDGGFG